jgi:hypothetical protein
LLANRAFEHPYRGLRCTETGGSDEKGERGC